MESRSDIVSPISSTRGTIMSGSTANEEQPISARMDRPPSMEMYSTLPEAIERPVESDKEVALGDGKEVAAHHEKEAAPEALRGDAPEFIDLAEKEDQPYPGLTNRQESFEKPADNTSDQPRRRRICGLSLLVFGLIVGALVAVAIGLGVGLGVGLGTASNKSHSSSSTPTSSSSSTSATGTTVAPAQTATSTPAIIQETLVGGALNPQYYSTSGAFNGTGIDIGSAAFIGNLPGYNTSKADVLLYYQHWTGDLRFMIHNSTGWYGGGPNEVVATDAKNATAISSQNFSYGNVSYWHVFYVNTNNKVSQRIMSTVTNSWNYGSLTNISLSVMDDERVGLLSCYYGGGTADTDFGGSLTNNGIGMRLWAASNASTFNQLAWSAASPSDQWTFNQPWTGLNGHATPACLSWGGGGAGTTYTLFLDLNNSVNIFWRDTSSGVLPTESHPIGQWTNANAKIPNVDPSTQLTIAVFQPEILWAQPNYTNTIQGYNITWKAENTTIVSTTPISVEASSGRGPLNGTHLTVAAVNDPVNGEQDIMLFSQVAGNDITVYTLGLSEIQNGAAWNATTVPIPS